MRTAPAIPIGITYTKPSRKMPKIAHGAAFEMASAMLGTNWMNSAP